MKFPSHWRLVREGIATITEIENIMSLDDVDLWHLYLDAIEEAQDRANDKARG